MTWPRNGFLVYDTEGTRLGANEKAKSWELMSSERLEAARETENWEWVESAGKGMVA